MDSVANICDKKKRKVTDDVSVSTSNYNNNGDFGIGCPCMEAGYLDTLPIGYRFKPPDEELISHYLLKKIKNLNLPKNKISDVNVYKNHPKDITENNPEAKEGEWYFFTSRNRKYANGKRPSRKAGCGYWKATGPDTVIKDNTGKKVGGKKSLVYHEGNPLKGNKTDWMMHEYVVEGHTRERMGSKDMKLDDYVLCKIYNKKYSKVQNVVIQQPTVASNDPENGSTEVPPDQQARVVSNQVVQLSNLLSNICHVENNLPNLDSNDQHLNVDLKNAEMEVKRQVMVSDQHARAVSNQNVNRPTNFQIENNAVVQLSDLLSNIRCVENNLPNLYFNQHLNPRVQNTVPEVKRDEVMVSDQRARVVSNLDVNPTIYQVETNMITQSSLHYHDLNMGYDLYKTRFPKMGTPLVNHSSESQFINKQLMANRSSHFPPPPIAEQLGFQEGNSFNQFDFNRYIERMFSNDANDGVLDEQYKYMFDEHGLLLDTDELKKFKGPNGEDKTI